VKIDRILAKMENFISADARFAREDRCLTERGRGDFQPLPIIIIAERDLPSRFVAIQLDLRNPVELAECECGIAAPLEVLAKKISTRT